MAKINNSQVIQKIIDELELYPGKDIMPTELADKILPVFQINSDEVTVQNTPANVVESATHPGTYGSVTVYTVPATGNFYLCNATLNFSALADNLSGAIYLHLSIMIKGTTKNLISLPDDANTTNLIHTAGSTLNLQNPILLDKGSTITMSVSSDHSNASGSANIVGYTTD